MPVTFRVDNSFDHIPELKFQRAPGLFVENLHELLSFFFNKNISVFGFKSRKILNELIFSSKISVYLVIKVVKHLTSRFPNKLV